jgi:hypothetical protein
MNLKFHPNLVKFKVQLKKNFCGNQGGQLGAEAGVGVGQRPKASSRHWWPRACLRGGIGGGGPAWGSGPAQAAVQTLGWQPAKGHGPTSAAVL